MLYCLDCRLPVRSLLIVFGSVRVQLYPEREVVQDIVENKSSN